MYHNEDDYIKTQLMNENNNLVAAFKETFIDKQTGRRRNEVQAQQYVDGGRYEGEIQGGIRKGYGIYFFPSGYVLDLAKRCLFRRVER